MPTSTRPYLAIEVGFHSEYPKAAENDAVIAHLVANEKRWRRLVGKEAQVGEFLGRADKWRRVSETWPDPNLSDGCPRHRAGRTPHRLHHRAGTRAPQLARVDRGYRWPMQLCGPVPLVSLNVASGHMV